MSMKNILLFIVVVIIFLGCISMQISRNRINKNGKVHGKLIIDFECPNCIYKNIRLGMNLSKNIPLKSFSSESSRMVHELSIFRIEGYSTGQVVYEIPEDDYQANAIFTPGIPILFPINLVYSETSNEAFFGLNHIEEFEVDQERNNEYICANQNIEGNIMTFLFFSGLRNVAICPKIKIRSGQITKIKISFGAQEFRGFETLFKWVPGIFWLAPIISGGTVFERKFQTKISNPVKFNSNKVQKDQLYD